MLEMDPMVVMAVPSTTGLSEEIFRKREKGTSVFWRALSARTQLFDRKKPPLHGFTDEAKRYKCYRKYSQFNHGYLHKMSF